MPDTNEKPAVHAEQLKQDCPRCHTGNLWANVQYKHKTVVAHCEQCNFDGRVENPNFQFDIRQAAAKRISQCLMKAELQEVIDKVMFTDDVIKTNSAMFLLRNSEAHEPEAFKTAFPEFKANLQLLLKVVEFYETGEIVDVEEFEAPAILKLYMATDCDGFMTRAGFPSVEAATRFKIEWERLGHSVAWVKC